MNTKTTSIQNTFSVLLKMEAAINAHDIDTFVNGFSPDFVGEQPVHPERNFTGAEQVRKNWTALFAQVPDIQAKLITHTISDELGWSEWHWQGNHTNGTELDMRGVVVVGLRENAIAWARLCMEQLAQVVQADILKAV
ncbi:nuclear transport factor 2 family protein [Phormidium tenue FACHB-886]|nr:nuclear transport factor 2 family protein [Phormidium tenue FACHB-886]